MLQRLLVIFLILIGIGFLIYSFIGAEGEIERRKGFFTNPFTVLFEGLDVASSGNNSLPFPFPSTPAIPVGDDNTFYDDSFALIDTESELLSLEQEYDVLQRRVAEAQTFGDPSPYRGLVAIIDSYTGTATTDPALEYITLEAHTQNTAPISIAGWSLQSVYSHNRPTIPAGTRTFVMGEIPKQVEIYLDPGENAIVSSGISPIGTSFKETRCTGYLGQFQTFVPSLYESCPSPESEVLSEPATSRTNDPSCVAFASRIPLCSFYFGEVPSGITAQCYSLIRNSLTYNGCVSRNSWRPSFSGDTWRVFLGRGQELWGVDHDVIRLLDREGRVVDVLSY